MRPGALNKGFKPKQHAPPYHGIGRLLRSFELLRRFRTFGGEHPQPWDRHLRRSQGRRGILGHRLGRRGVLRGFAAGAYTRPLFSST